VNRNCVREYAAELERQLERHKREDAQVQTLADSLSPLFDQIRSGSMKEPFEHIPGDYWFTEGSLGRFSDLENAFSKFKLAALGELEKPTTLALLDRIRQLRRE